MTHGTCFWKQYLYELPLGDLWKPPAFNPNLNLVHLVQLRKNDKVHYFVLLHNDWYQHYRHYFIATLSVGIIRTIPNVVKVHIELKDGRNSDK